MRLSFCLRVRFNCWPPRRSEASPGCCAEDILAEFADRDVVDTVRDGLLVLDANLVVVFASRSFYRMFSVVPEETEGKKLYDLGDGQWDIPALRHLLEKIIPEQTTVEAYEVEHNFPVLGPRVMLLNARRIVREVDFFMLAIDDITDRRTTERERDALSRSLQKASQESAHRIKNSLMLLSSFVRIQRRSAEGGDTRQALDEIESRIDAISRLYESLSHVELGAPLPVRPYLEGLCSDLRRAITNGTAVTLECESTDVELDADRLVALGLAVNELVTNATRYAFVNQDRGTIAVRVDSDDGHIFVNVSDNGSGVEKPPRTDSGLGQIIVRSFVERLEGSMAIETSEAGTTVTITIPI